MTNYQYESLLEITTDYAYRLKLISRLAQLYVSIDTDLTLV